MASGIRTVKIRFTGDNDLGKTVASVNRTMKALSDDIGKNFAGIGEVFAGGLKSPAALTAITAAGLAAGTTLGAAISAAIPLAFGGGALALGIKAAANDPAVQAAFGEFSTKGKAVLDEFGQAFKGPLIRAAQTFGAALDAMRPTFIEISKITAPLVDLLAPALAQMAKNSLPGIKAAIAASVPLFQIIAAEAPKLATAFSEFLITITKNGPAAAQFLKDFFTVTIAAIKVTGAVIGWLASEYVRMRNTWVAVGKAVMVTWNAVASFFSKIAAKIGASLSRAGDQFNSFKNKVIGVWNAIVNKIESAVNRIIGLWNRLKSLASQAINFNVGGFSLGGLFGGGRAAGGPVMGGRTYLVGERGPELITMGGNGHVTPNHALSGGPDVLEVHVDLGNDIQRVISINLKDHDRQLKRAAMAGGRG
jgi:phage-related protein